VNNDGLYNYLNGDYPGFDLSGSFTDCCNILNGDQALWWVINDVGNVHSETLSAQIGLEIHCQAFAYSTIDADINNTTFYQYKIINRSSNPLNQAFLGIWVDPDLGNAVDDYVGCDVARGLGYCYNGDNDDDGGAGYGMNPPAVGIDFLRGPQADLNDGIDNDRDGCIDCTILIVGGTPTIIGDDTLAENWAMSRFVYYNNLNNSPTGNPSGFADFYNYLQGIWLDGLPMTYGGDGRNPNNPVTNFMFPGNTDTTFFPTLGAWTEVTAGNLPADRRFLMSAGPFTLQAGEVNCVVTAVVWDRDQVNWVNSSITELEGADDKIQNFFNGCFDVTTIGIESNVVDFDFSIMPNPFNDFALIHLEGNTGEKYTLNIFTLNGQKVETLEIHNGTYKLFRGDKVQGVYICSVMNQDGAMVRRQKIIIY